MTATRPLLKEIPLLSIAHSPGLDRSAMTEKVQPTSKTSKWSTEERKLLKATESWIMMRGK